jgi:hypothetical protein
MSARNAPFYSLKPQLWVSGLILLAILRSARTAIPFIQTHWAFSYELGFIKRGLMGEILRKLSLSPTPFTVNLISLILFAAVAVCLLFHFSTFTRTHPQHPGSWLFLLWAGTSPATLQRFAWDSGRFDGLGLLALCTGIAWINRPETCGRLTAYLPLLILAPLLILIHEAQLVMFIPLWLTWTLHQFNSASQPSASQSATLGKHLCSSVSTCGSHLSFPATRLLMPALLFFACTALAIHVSNISVLHGITHPEYIQHLETTGATVCPLAAEIPFRNVRENWIYNLGLVFRTTVLPYHILYLAGMFPAGLLFLRIFRTIRPHVPDLLLLLLACSTPLTLYAIGLDHFRWQALTLLNLFLLLIWLSDDPRVRTDLLDCITQNRKLVYLSTLSAFITGSLGDFRSFALLETWAR